MSSLKTVSITFDPKLGFPPIIWKAEMGERLGKAGEILTNALEHMSQFPPETWSTWLEANLDVHMDYLTDYICSRSSWSTKDANEVARDVLTSFPKLHLHWEDFAKALESHKYWDPELETSEEEQLQRLQKRLQPLLTAVAKQRVAAAAKAGVPREI